MLSLAHRVVGRGVDPEAAFARLYADQPVAFWLDSCPHGGFGARWSFMGDARGPFAERLRVDAATGEVTLARGGGAARAGDDLFAHLRAASTRFGGAEGEPPFPFVGGHVGYLGYELKAAMGMRTSHAPPYPDAQLMLADRFLAFDHETGAVHAAALCEDTGRGEAEAWMSAAEAALGTVSPLELDLGAVRPAATSRRWRHDRDAYRALIETCRTALLDGESYEICLTNTLEIDAALDPFTTYRVLRRINPAPRSAYLGFDDLCVLCSSPEQFLTASCDGLLEAKPIKGTRRRGDTPAADARLAEDLAASVKDRAENLMITDLLRNDLGRVCAAGSVHVPALMAVESYPSVHQLVSTIRGRLAEGRDVIDAVAALFPGGSMTGAPKIRTMEILDRLEAGPRGVYSGAIGWIGLDGAADLDIVIRTLVLHAGRASIGAGGAITVLSDPDDEIAEMELKAEALIRAAELARGLGT